jgi:hypothetical protein
LRISPARPTHTHTANLESGLSFRQSLTAGAWIQRRGGMNTQNMATTQGWHDMWTDKQIADEYSRIEALANKTPQGADHDRILDIVTAKSGRPLSDVLRVVTENTFTKPN